MGEYGGIGVRGQQYYARKDTGERICVWFGGLHGREISRDIMCWHAWPKKMKNEQQTHSTWTKARIIHAYNLNKSKHDPKAS